MQYEEEGKKEKRRKNRRIVMIMINERKECGKVKGCDGIKRKEEKARIKNKVMTVRMMNEDRKPIMMSIGVRGMSEERIRSLKRNYGVEDYYFKNEDDNE